MKLMQHHNKLHPPKSVAGELEHWYWIERIMPDGEGCLLLLYFHYIKLSSDPFYKQTSFVYRLGTDKMERIEELTGSLAALFSEADAKVPSELQLLCLLSAGQGGGSKVSVEIASTRLGQVFHLDTEEDESPPDEFLLFHYDKVPDRALSDGEREFLVGRIFKRYEEAFLSQGDPRAMIDIYGLVEDLVSYRQRDAGLQKVKSLFHQWDVNGDGMIGVQELTSVLTMVGVSDEDAMTCFVAADANKDGQIGFDEFVSWIYKSPENVQTATGVRAYAR